MSVINQERVVKVEKDAPHSHILAARVPGDGRTGLPGDEEPRWGQQIRASSAVRPTRWSLFVRLPSGQTASVLALIDFGNTLAVETFMRRDSESFPTWTSTWLRTMTKTRLDWDTGSLSTDELADVIAAELGCTAQAVRGYMSQLCRQINFYPTVNAAIRRRRARGGRQALVTVNPDLIEEVVSHYSLLDIFDAVITSASQGTDDKVELCWRAGVPGSR